jgi:hypothetical protein
VRRLLRRLRFWSDNDMTQHSALAHRLSPSLGMLCSAHCSCMRVHRA